MRKQQIQNPGLAIDSPNTSPSSRLLALPAELREEIWRLVLGGDVIKISQENSPRIPEPDLAWTSRQIRAETLPVFWAHSIFDGKHASMVKFFGLIGRQNTELIRHVRHSEHVGLNTLSAIGLTLGILGDAYETLGLRRGALHLPLLIEGEGESWVNLHAALHLEQVWMGMGLSKMPRVRWKNGTAVKGKLEQRFFPGRRLIL